ncbi:MAG: hypothetical protein JXQ75_21165 [Phycisphaerae bacterium]|nr:hypothetical protein [Phycisphaerae bacterium]
MSQCLLPLSLVASLCIPTSGLLAQTTSKARGDEEEPRTSVRADPPRQSAVRPYDILLREQSAGGEQAGQAEEWYRLASGRYVRPHPYRPDLYSPRMRTYPDYGTQRRPYSSRHGHIRSPYRHNRLPRRAYGPGYRHGYVYDYGYSPYWGDAWDAYEQGRYDADHEYVWYIAAARAGRLLNQHREMFDEAIIMFRDGRYDWAAIKLLGAAEKNQADAASRLHAGHALFALGRYGEATKLIARAFELSPSLPHKQYDIRDEYGDKADFDRHLRALKAHAAKHPDDAGAMTLLGYVTYYTEGPGDAHPYLEQAARLDPNSYFIPKLLTLARMASGMEKEPVAPSETRSPQKPHSRTAVVKSPLRRV